MLTSKQKPKKYSKTILQVLMRKNKRIALVRKWNRTNFGKTKVSFILPAHGLMFLPGNWEIFIFHMEIFQL